MKTIADLHIHSRFSRATSPQMNIPVLDEFAAIKGIDVLGTGDFTHPVHFAEMRELLKPNGKGLYKYKKSHFMLSAEVNSLFYKDGRAKNVHCVLLAPYFEVVDELNRQLSLYGDLAQDGRPFLRLEAARLVDICMKISKDILIVPAHIWTPYFSLFGERSKFSSMEECFGEHTENIYAVETGLSSDPAMNWRLSQLDKYTLLSNSDCHSPSKIGREANIFEAEQDYFEIADIIRKKDKDRFVETIEFFPEEGKYHFDGHRDCKQCMHPRDTLAAGGICPKCHRKVTVGVAHRVELLADREEGIIPDNAIKFRSIIPLQEIIADVFQKGVATKTVAKEYNSLIEKFGNEFDILLEVDGDSLRKGASSKISQAILNVREGKVKIFPGYDGEYGKIDIQKGNELSKSTEQMELF